METETLGVCVYDGCAYRLMPWKRWYDASKDQRRTWTAAGILLHQGRGLCRRHYDHCRTNGTLVDFELKGVPRDVVLEEWERMDKGGSSRAEAAKLLAPRLGMTYAALEKALDRAKVGPHMPSMPGWVNGVAS